MSAEIRRSPLTWPVGWPRTSSALRARARFSHRGGSYPKPVTVSQGIARVLEQLELMGLSEDEIVISTNLVLRLDGMPRSEQAEPEDPGVAVYWQPRGGDQRCMAIDHYDRVADNLAAVAATLDAMRAIKRHGGAEILDRAFLGFAALPSPSSSRHWFEVLGIDESATAEEVEQAYKRKRKAAHPDAGGTPEAWYELQTAISEARRSVSG